MLARLAFRLSLFLLLIASPSFARSIGLGVSQVLVEDPVGYSTGANFFVEFGYWQNVHFNVFLNYWGNEEKIKSTANETKLHLQSVSYGIVSQYRFDLNAFRPYAGLGFGFEEFSQKVGARSFGTSSKSLVFVSAGVSATHYLPWTLFSEIGQFLPVSLYGGNFFQIGISYEI